MVSMPLLDMRWTSQSIITNTVWQVINFMYRYMTLELLHVIRDYNIHLQRTSIPNHAGLIT